MTGDPSESASSDETPTQHFSAPPAVYAQAHEQAHEQAPMPPAHTSANAADLLTDLPTARITVAPSTPLSAFVLSQSDAAQMETTRIPSSAHPVGAEPFHVAPVPSASNQPPSAPSAPSAPSGPSAALYQPLQMGASNASDSGDLYDDMQAQNEPRGDTRGDLLPIFSLRDSEMIQQREWTGWQRAVGWVNHKDRHKRKRGSARRGIILAIAAVLLVGVPALLAVSLWPSLGINLIGANKTPAGPTQWARDTQRTPPDPDDAAFAAQQYPVDAAFQSYYTSHNGAALLGVALTPGFATAQGRVQFFVGGALLAPNSNAQTASASATSAPGDITDQLAQSGHSDKATHVIWLPLIQSLLTAGSEAQALPLLSASAAGTGGANATPTTAPTITQSSALTYADLRHAAIPDAFIPAPARGANLDGAVFVAEGKRNGKPIGHLIPASIWAWLQSPTDAPDGWKTDIGDPLTEALPLTITLNGQTHHLLAQAFMQTALVYDQDDANAADGPAITPLTLGESYLLTLGPPTVAATPNVKTWATGDTALLDAPQTGKALAHIGLNFPLALTSDAAQWRQGVLWYKAAWQNGHANGAGWIPVTTLTFTAPPANSDAWASFDVLSPSLAHYLTNLGSNVGAVVYDVTRHQYYTYNASGLFIQASSAKVPLMVAYLNWIESQGSSPNAYEQNILSTMIENSNNDSAQVIYDTLGYDIGLNAYLNSIGITDYHSDPNGWGWGRWSPFDMAHILTLLQEGKILNASDRAYALSLMRNIEPDQRMGIGETAPPGAVYEMKDGWVPGPDGLWDINTSGIVTVGSETYIITVYTGEQTSYDGGWYITRQVCRPVGQLLT